MKKFLCLISISLFALTLTSCATNPYGQPQFSKRAVVTVLGAGAGALLGAQFGGGQGKLASVAVGTALGGALAYWLAEGMDTADRQVVNYALENSHDGQALPWKNTSTDRVYEVTPVRTYQEPSGQYCREFTTEIYVGGEKQTGYGTACRQPDGAWKIVESR